ncbi:MAG TPA: hypothetical protein VNL74_05350 [Methylococcus sp.]|nr:hypothetical protein [Methylococcus sp.]
MIQILGTMIGCYIITRMLEITGRKDCGLLTMLSAAITFLVALFGMMGLFLIGLDTASALRGLDPRF